MRQENGDCRVRLSVIACWRQQLAAAMYQQALAKLDRARSPRFLLSETLTRLAVMASNFSELLSHFGSLSLVEAAATIRDQRLPPVERWDPPDCGDSHMEIRSDGSWWHRGDPILRPALVQLFASILRRESDGSYVLVTPHEKQRIHVADLPFRAVELLTEGEGAGRQLLFRLDTGGLVAAGRDHMLAFAEVDGEPRPELHVRGRPDMGLSARIGRSVFYELVELAIGEGDDPPAIWSGGVRFELAA